MLARWLEGHPAFRVATTADCDCAADIQRMRTVSAGVWKAVPDHDPYPARGDLSGDDAVEVAVVVLERCGSIGKATLLVLNGPIDLKNVSPAFIESGIDMRSKGLYFGPPRPKPCRLLVGRFESDNTMLLAPRGHSYRLVHSWRTIRGPTALHLYSDRYAALHPCWNSFRILRSLEHSHLWPDALGCDRLRRDRAALQLSP